MIKTFENFIQEDPYGEEIWNEKEDMENEVDVLGEPMFRNYYKCSECGTEWSDVWDATCDDSCPNCAEIMSPIESEDVFESHNEIDPYGEEQWQEDEFIPDKTLQELHNMLENEGWGIQRLHIFEFSEETIVTFNIDYPHRGMLNFTISRNLDGEISLCCDNIIGRFAIDSVILNTTESKEFWDKLTDLVEKNIDKREYI